MQQGFARTAQVVCTPQQNNRDLANSARQALGQCTATQSAKQRLETGINSCCFTVAVHKVPVALLRRVDNQVQGFAVFAAMLVNECLPVTPSRMEGCLSSLMGVIYVQWCLMSGQCFAAMPINERLPVMPSRMATCLSNLMGPT